MKNKIRAFDIIMLSLVILLNIIWVINYLIDFFEYRQFNILDLVKQMCFSIPFTYIIESALIYLGLPLIVIITQLRGMSKAWSIMAIAFQIIQIISIFWVILVAALIGLEGHRIIGLWTYPFGFIINLVYLIRKKEQNNG